MTVVGLVRRALRWGIGWWWQSVRPARGAAFPDAGPARPVHETGRAPHPHERWSAAGTPTGPWADVEPHAAGAWPRRGTLAVLAAWAGMVAFRVRRDLRANGFMTDAEERA